MTQARPFSTLIPPPMGGLATAYFTPLMAPVPVATRYPKPTATEDTVNGFLRIEAAGGAVMGNEILFNCSVILHSYAPNSEESQAELNLQTALGWGGNAQGTVIVHPSTQKPYYVTYSRITGVGAKQGDPQVNLTRFRGVVMWRIRGEAL